MSGSRFIAIDTRMMERRFEYIKIVNLQGTFFDYFIITNKGKNFFMKRLKDKYAHDSIHQRILQKEYEICSDIDHPNIVKHISINNDECGYYILMENVLGMTLDSFIVVNPKYFHNRKNLDRFFNQLLSALRCLHEKEIVFCDLKPENIMITQIGNNVKLIDFGFCLTNDYTSTEGMTEEYGAPEQFTNGILNITTDIYGIGKIIEYIGLNISGCLPNIYTRIMIKCTKKNQHDRFQGTEEIVYLINRRRHTIRKSVIAIAISIILFLSFRTLIYTEIFNSWWDSFELMPDIVEYDIKSGHTFYRIIDKNEKTGMVVGCSGNPNIYIRPEVTINGEIYHITKIGDDAFKNKKFIKSVYIPESITEIGKDAFTGCTNLLTLDIPNSVTHINNNAFYGCNNITHLSLSDSISEISMELAASTQIQQIIVPEGVTVIELDAFGNCKRLRDVKLPSTLEKIERGVFWNCISLKEITIPQGVKEIGCYVFFGCDNLTDIYNYAIEPQHVLPIHRNPQKVTLHVPAKSIEAYRKAEQWGKMRIVGDL